MANRHVDVPADGDRDAAKRSQVHALCAMVIMSSASAVLSMGGGLLFFLSILVPRAVAAIAGKRPFAFGALTAITYWLALQIVMYVYSAAHHSPYDWDAVEMFGTFAYLIGVSLVACVPVYASQKRANRESN